MRPVTPAEFNQVGVSLSAKVAHVHTIVICGCSECRAVGASVADLPTEPARLILVLEECSVVVECNLGALEE